MYEIWLEILENIKRDPDLAALYDLEAIIKFIEELKQEG